MASFSDVLSTCLVDDLSARRRNIIDWTRTKDVIAAEFNLDDQAMNISLVSHNNFQPRLRQRGFDGPLDLAVLVLDADSMFTDRVRAGLHRHRTRPDWPLMLIQETPSGRYRGLCLVLGPTNSTALKQRAESSIPGMQVVRYEAVWH
jgi:hypothetical protein